MRVAWVLVLMFCCGCWISKPPSHETRITTPGSSTQPFVTIEHSNTQGQVAVGTGVNNDMKGSTFILNGNAWAVLATVGTLAALMALAISVKRIFRKPKS